MGEVSNLDDYILAVASACPVLETISVVDYSYDEFIDPSYTEEVTSVKIQRDDTSGGGVTLSHDPSYYSSPSPVKWHTNFGKLPLVEFLST